MQGITVELQEVRWRVCIGTLDISDYTAMQINCKARLYWDLTVLYSWFACLDQHISCLQLQEVRERPYKAGTYLSF